MSRSRNSRRGTRDYGGISDGALLWDMRRIKKLVCRRDKALAHRLERRAQQRRTDRQFNLATDEEAPMAERDCRADRDDSQRCEGCSTLLIDAECEQVAGYEVDNEGVYLCLPCWDALIEVHASREEDLRG